jgi:hypothetical protein
VNGRSGAGTMTASISASLVPMCSACARLSAR